MTESFFILNKDNVIAQLCFVLSWLLLAYWYFILFIVVIAGLPDRYVGNTSWCETYRAGRNVLLIFKLRPCHLDGRSIQISRFFPVNPNDWWSSHTSGDVAVPL